MLRRQITSKLYIPEVRGCIRIDHKQHVKLFFTRFSRRLPQWFLLLNYMPHVLSCSTCSHASRVSCRMCSLALRVSCSTCSRAHSASCPTCSRALGASCPTCSCVWRASYCTYPVLYVPRASRFLSPFFLLYVLILPFVLLSFHAPRSYFSVHLLLVIFFGKFIKVKTNVVYH